MIGFTDLKNMHICSLAGQDALLAVENPKTKTLQPTPLFFEIRDKIEAERPKLVVFDTLADLFGANENDRALARQFVGMLRGLAIQFQCAVVSVGTSITQRHVKRIRHKRINWVE